MARRKDKAAEEQAAKGNYQDAFADQQADKHDGAGSSGSAREMAKQKNARGGKFIVTTSDGDNPIEDHSFAPYILESIGKLSQHMINGMPVERFTEDGQLRPDYIPGIMTMGFIPTAGDANSSTAGINIANDTLFDFVRSKTSGTSYFEAPDLGLYNLCTSNVYLVYSLACRLYGTISAYEVQNTYVPDNLLNLQGFDTDDFRTHKVEFLGWLNDYAVRIANLVMPLNIKYFTRMMWLVSNYYKDSDSATAQIYQFVPLSVFQLQEGISAGRRRWYIAKMNKAADDLPQTYAKLIPVPWAKTGVMPQSGNGLCTMTEFTQFADMLYDSIRASQDMKYISSAYLRAFEGKTMLVQKLDEDYEVTPVFNEKVLMQIENAKFVPMVEDYAYIVKEDITLNKGYLVSNGIFHTIYNTNASLFTIPAERTALVNALIPTKWQTRERLLNFHDKFELSPENVCEASRMCSWELGANVPSGAATPFKNTDLVGNTDTSVIADFQPDDAYWYSLGTHASEIFIYASLSYNAFKNVAQPWKDTELQTIQIQTLNVVLDYSQRMYNSIKDVTVGGANNTWSWQSLTNMLNTLISDRESLEDAMALIDNWDWHPAMERVVAKFGSGSDVAVDILFDNPTELDYDKVAVMNHDQLVSMNRYDTESLFICREIGEFMPK